MLVSDSLKYAWCLGSLPGFCDVVEVTPSDTSSVSVIDPPVLDGHKYFATVFVSKRINTILQYMRVNDDKILQL